MAVEATATAIRRDAKVLGLVGSAHFTSHFYLLALPPLFPILKDEFGVGYAALGLLMTAINVGTGLAQTPVGFLVDRLGAAPILIAGQATLALAFVLAGFTSSYQALLLLMLLAGLGNAVLHPADYAIMSAAVEPRRLGRAFGLHTFAGHLGWAVAPVTMIALAGLLGWRTALVAVGAAGLVVSLALVLGRRFLDDGAGDRGARPAADGPAPAKPGASVLVSAPILIMFAFYVVTAAANAGLHSFSVNAGLTVFLSAGAAGVLMGGVIADRTVRHELVATLAFLGAGLAVFALGQVALPALLLMAVFGFAGFTLGLVRPARDMMVRRITPAGASGRVFGFVSTGLNVGAAAAPPLLGWILDQGGAGALFVIVPAFLVAAIAAVMAVRPRA